MATALTYNSDVTITIPADHQITRKAGVFNRYLKRNLTDDRRHIGIAPPGDGTTVCGTDDSAGGAGHYGTKL